MKQTPLKIPRHEVHRYLNDGYFVRAAFEKENGHTTVSATHYDAWRPLPRLLNENQQRLFFYIQESIYTNGYAPTYTEMMKAMGCSRSAVANWINALIEAGFIAVAPQQTRGIALVESSARTTKAGI